jgi:hypothetical protein
MPTIVRIGLVIVKKSKSQKKNAEAADIAEHE